jgi:hypothetical protein
VADKPKKKWIKAATKERGAFSAKAEEAGKSTREYAEEKRDAPGKLGKEARLAETLMSISKAERLYRAKRVRKD